jgi:hypothetical protein
MNRVGQALTTQSWASTAREIMNANESATLTLRGRETGSGIEISQTASRSGRVNRNHDDSNKRGRHSIGSGTGRGFPARAFCRLSTDA